MTFYVTPSGLIFSQLPSFDEDESLDTALKKKPRTEADSYLVAHVTSSNLSRDTLYLLKGFARSNGLNGRSCEIDLINLQGKSWMLGLGYNRTSGQAYIKGGWRDFCYKNGLETGSFYRFKFVGNKTRPSLMLCSNTKVNYESIELAQASEDEEAPEERETRFQKKAPVFVGGASRCTRRSNKSSVDPKNLRCKQPIQPLTTSNQVKKVKQSILDTLIGVKRFRSELKIKEQNLEASLKDIEALGERVLEINKIFK